MGIFSSRLSHTPLSYLLDRESKVSFIVSEDENEMDTKQPARRMKPASRKRKYFISLNGCLDVDYL